MKRIPLIALALGLLFVATVKAAPTTAYHSAAESRTVVLINQIRAQHGLHALTIDPKLATAAREHSGDMLARGYFEHDGPGSPFVKRVRGYVGNRALIAENIAYGSGPYSKAPGIVDGWMHSAPHRAIILTPSLRRIGVGVAYGSYRGHSGIGMATADFSS